MADPKTKTMVSWFQNPEAQETSCPRCGAETVEAQDARFCERCGWNLAHPKAVKGLSLMDGFYRWQHLRSGVDVGKTPSAEARPAFSLARLAAYGLALLINGVAAFFILYGLYFCLFQPTEQPSFNLTIGLGCFLLAWLFFPEPPRAAGKPLPREAAPELYALTERLAQALGAAPNVKINWTPRFEFSAGYDGWRRQPTLVLGLPLLALLNGPERVALLSQGLAGLASPDPHHDMWISLALQTLEAWWKMARPANKGERFAGEKAAWGVNSFLLLPLAGLAWLLGAALSLLLWPEHRRAEALAGRRAAQVSGTASARTCLQQTSLSPLVLSLWLAAYDAQQEAPFFTGLRAAVEATPEPERALLRWRERLSGGGFVPLQPPAADRVHELEALGDSLAQVTLRPEEESRLQAEIEPLCQLLQNESFSLDEAQFFQLAGIPMPGK